MKQPRVLIKLELDGSIEKGFRVWLRIPAPEQQEVGKLPDAIKVSQDYSDWQNTYRSIIRGRIKFTPTQTPAQVMQVRLRPKTQTVDTTLNDWLKADEFKPVEEALRSQLDKAQVLNKEVRILLQIGEQTELRHLPWSAWKLPSHYDNAEIAISSPSYGKPKQAEIKGRLKILVILGDAKGIDVEVDRQLFQNLPGKPNVCFLKEPSRQEFHEHLFNQAWDILFFAGHSRTVDHQGLMYLNPQDEVPISELTQALRESVSRGLKIAIFNSCDGMGFISALEQAQVNIPQMIVMREPVPDRVAQQFLRDFLKAFSGGQTEPKVIRSRRFNRQWLCQQFQSVGQILRSILGLSTATRRPKSFYTAVKSARRELEKFERDYPAASWLPVIYQNPAVEPPTWAELTRQPIYPRLQFRAILAISLAVTCLVMGVRMQGTMQRLELKAYDHLMQTRPMEKPDPRLLVINIDNIDVADQKSGKGKGSLDDPTLFALIQSLEKHQPKVIGFDIVRLDPITPEYESTLGKRLSSSQDPPLVFPCSGKTENSSGKAKPPQVPDELIGFDNVPKDIDDVIRRYFLMEKPKGTDLNCNAHESLGFNLAMSYLTQVNQNLQLGRTPEDYLTLGDQIFIRPNQFSGGYQNNPDVNKDIDQFILNYYPYQDFSDIAYNVTLHEIQTGKVSTEKIKDKIVLIGQIDTLSDRYLTPYSVPGNTPGVYIHAQAVSQILSAVLDHRKLMSWLPLWADWLWVWFWAVMSCLLVQLVRQLNGQQNNWLELGSVSILGLIVHYLCRFAMWEALWLPLIPTLASISMSYTVCLLLLKMQHKEDYS